MKIEVQLKDPDALYESIRDSFGNFVIDDLNDEELETIKEKRINDLTQKCSGKWFKWGEYLTVKIDTDLMTCVVVPNKELNED